MKGVPTEEESTGKNSAAAIARIHDKCCSGEVVFMGAGGGHDGERITAPPFSFVKVVFQRFYESVRGTTVYGDGGIEISLLEEVQHRKSKFRKEGAEISTTDPAFPTTLIFCTL